MLFDDWAAEAALRSKEGGSVLEDADARPVILVKGVPAGSYDPGLDQVDALLVCERRACRVLGQQLAGFLVVGHGVVRPLLVPSSHEVCELRVDQSGVTGAVQLGKPVLRAVVIDAKAAKRDVVAAERRVPLDGLAFGHLQLYFEAKRRLPLDLDLRGQRAKWGG